MIAPFYFCTLIILAFTLAFGRAQADERVLPLSVIQKMGYRPFNSFPHYRGQRPVRSELPTNLKWPVQFVDAARTIAQNYVNFQQYGFALPYYHKGCDLRSPAHSVVRAPVTGILEGGYYSYTDNPDGSEIKHWIPWSGKPHNDPYFELAVVTADGYRFEMHHIDSMNLPKETIQALNKDNVVVQEGTVIGTVIPWSNDYDHIHYNIFRQDGVVVNPEAYTVSPPDHAAPKIHGVYGVRADGSVIELVNGGTVGPLQQIIVATTETRDHNIYVQTPPYIGIQFQTRQLFAWDFRKVLLGPDQKWPDIRQVFVAKLKTPSGKTLSTTGQYGKGLFLMRLMVPTARGPFVIAVADTAGNTAKFSGVMQ